MARPIKEGLDYFPFGVDALDDEIIEAVSVEFGIIAELAVIRLISAIYKKGYFMEWNQLTRAKILKKLTGMQAETLDAIIERLVEYGFFDERLFRNEQILTSKEMQEVYLNATMRRKRPENMKYTLINASDEVNVDINAPTKGVNVDINTQSKVKESKLKENKLKCVNKNINNNTYSLGNETLTHTHYESLVKEFDKETVDRIINRIISRPYHGCLNYDTIKRWCNEAKQRAKVMPFTTYGAKSSFHNFSLKNDYDMDAINDMILNDSFNPTEKHEHG